MFGYTMISIAAIFATTGAINSQLYATIGATYSMAKDGHLPPIFSLKRRRREGGTQGLVISSLLIILLAVFFDVTAIASIGSAVSLAIFALLTIAHIRMAKDTGASKLVLYVALVATCLAILLFAGTPSSRHEYQILMHHHPGLGGGGDLEEVQQARAESQ
jgi:amino acid transporter